MIAIRDSNPASAFILASLVASYPDDSFCDNVRLLLEDEQVTSALGPSSVASLAELRSRLADLLGDPARLDDLRSEFIDRFDRGKVVTSLYETEYGRERAMVKGNELADIAGFYRAFGFETGGEGVLPEMIDHVAVELEFYALLLLKEQTLAERNDEEGVTVVRDARTKFIVDHLGRFIGALRKRPGVVDSGFYSAAFRYCDDLVLEEAKRLQVQVCPVEWLAGQAEAPQMACGGTVGCLK